MIDCFTTHSTQNRSFRRRSSQPISCHSTEETKSNTTKAHLHNWTIIRNNPKKLNLTQINCNTQYNHRKSKSNQQTTVSSVHMCTLHCAQLLHIILHRTDLIISPSYPPDNHCSDDVYLREGRGYNMPQNFCLAACTSITSTLRRLTKYHFLVKSMEKWPRQ